MSNHWKKCKICDKIQPVPMEEIEIKWEDWICGANHDNTEVIDKSPKTIVKPPKKRIKSGLGLRKKSG